MHAGRGLLTTPIQKTIFSNNYVISRWGDTIRSGVGRGGGVGGWEVYLLCYEGGWSKTLFARLGVWVNSDFFLL